MAEGAWHFQRIHNKFRMHTGIVPSALGDCTRLQHQVGCNIKFISILT